MSADIRFPNLGIEIQNVGKNISIGDFSIAYYGIIIAFVMVCGYLIAAWQAKRTAQNPEMYLDLALWDVIFAVIGARVYYVIFSLDYYLQNPMEIINLRGGGLAIYGGVIGGVITTFVFAKVRKVSFLKLADTAVAGLLTGQIIGRWGNFFNREAFGGYTDNLFAMQIRRLDVYESNISQELIDNLVLIDGEQYIQVHPTFLYESLWNVCVLVLILCITKKKVYDGQLFLLYLLGYGVGRAWIEGLRTDQLLVGNTQLAVSQILSIILVLLSGVLLVVGFVKCKKNKDNAIA